MALIDPGLLEIMACPFDRNDLVEDEPASRLVCTLVRSAIPGRGRHSEDAPGGCRTTL